MNTRKTFGWVIFAALVLVILVELPGVASRMCYNAGRKLYAAGKYQQAAAAYRGSVLFDRHFAQGYVQLGAAYRSLKSIRRRKPRFSQQKRSTTIRVQQP